MRTPIFEGAATALVTPMGQDGNIDYSQFSKLIENQIESGVSALVVCGTTGEASTLSDQEHISCIKFAVDEVKGRVPVIAGTGSNDTAYAVSLSVNAEKSGADALLLVTPYYNKTSQKGLLSHFGAVAEKVEIPIVLYNIKARTNMNIEIETMRALSEKYSNIRAVKECGEIDYFEQILSETDLDVYSGDDSKTVPVMSVGAKGVISVASNFFPGKWAEMCGYALKGDFLSARKIQLKYAKFCRLLFADVNPIPVKALMDRLGPVKAGKPRLPLVEPDEKVLDALIEEVNNIRNGG